MYDVFNLTSDESEFHCAGYLFRRTPTYKTATSKLFQRGTVTRRSNASEGSPLVQEKWVVDRPQRAGLMSVTYTAVWAADSPEPAAVITREAPRIFDVLLLWSLWGGEFAATGRRPPNLNPMFFGDTQFQTKKALREGIDAVLTSLTAERAEELGLNPSLFFLLESFRTDIANFQTLFISPVVDAVASRQIVPPLTEEEAVRLDELKGALQEVLDARRPEDEQNDHLWRNVIGPFSGSIDRLGAPAAADKLKQLLITSPALTELQLEADVLESHARAFNQFRNATLHYAGLPRDVRLTFASGRTERIRRQVARERMLRALLYYNQVFQQILLLHFSLEVGADMSWGKNRILVTLRDFFVRGLFNGHDWIEGAFMDDVIGEPVGD